MADNKLAPQSKNKLPWYEQALPMEGRATFLPFQDTMPGSVMNTRSWALPGIIAGAANAITAPGRAYSGSDPTFNPEEEAANFALNVMGGGMGASRAAPPPAGSLGMHTWHGSPHRFPPTAKNPLGEFDPTKIGTGEGAQSYGVGAAYLAENRTTGQTYNPNPGIASAAWDKSMKYWMDKLARNDNPIVAAKEIAILKEKMANQTGYLYKVDLPDEHIAKMLDFNKPLKDQSSEIQNAMQTLVKTDALGRPTGVSIDLNMNGQWAYERLARIRGAKYAAEAMRKENITGIKYLDAGSRGANKETRNFVVFDPAHMDILERNGVTAASLQAK